MTKCAVCGSQNEAEASFCGTCGSKLERVEAVEHANAAEVVPAPKPEPQAPAPQAVAAAPLTLTPPEIAAIPDAPGIKCPACGASNNISREFCWKCASALRPAAPPRPPSRFNRSFWLTFVLSTAVGVAVVVGGAALLRPSSPATPITIAGLNGDPIEFALQKGDPKPVDKLPAKSTIQLASFKKATEVGAPILNGRAPWWNLAVPRIRPISQYDNGPLERVNCVMASGAMLAALAYGIVTTGSRLRALQDDQEGATNWTDLEHAMQNGYGVHFLKGSLTPLA